MNSTGTKDSILYAKDVTKRYNSSRGWLTNSLAICCSCYHNILGMGLNARLKFRVDSLKCIHLETMELK